MKQTLINKIVYLIITSLVITISCSNNSFAADKDKSSRRAALMMQKMKQDMEAEKAAMQTQFDTQKNELEDKLKSNNEELAKVSKKLATVERKNKLLLSDVQKITLEKAALETKQRQTQVQLESTQVRLEESKTLYSQAQSDLKFNDGQRKTLSSNLALTNKTLSTCVEKNSKLHQFGTELIQIYDKPSTYEAVMRKESFFQLKRVELENILQTYQDNLNSELMVKNKPAS